MDKDGSKKEIERRLMKVVQSIFIAKNEHPEAFDELGIIIGHLQKAMNIIDDLPFE